MFEPVTILTGFLTVWAQMNNYGIDSERYPHLKDIRVRRNTQNQLYDYGNRVYNTKKDQTDSVIMKKIIESYYKGIERNRLKRQSKNIQNSGYIEDVIPLANYSPNSPYYSQNTAGVPYYYNAHNGNTAYNGNNGIYNTNNGNHYANNGHNNANNGLNAPSAYQRVPNENHQTQVRSGKYTLPNNSFNLQRTDLTAKNVNITGNNLRVYNPYAVNTNNQTAFPLTFNGNNGTSYNGYNVNNGLNNGFYNGNNGSYNGNNGLNNINNGFNVNNGLNSTTTVKVAYIMGSVGCPQFLRSATIFGTKVCVDDDYD